MTKKDIIKRLESFPDDAEIRIATKASGRRMLYCASGVQDPFNDKSIALIYANS